MLSLTQPVGTIKWMYRNLGAGKGMKGVNENFISTKGLPGHQLIRYGDGTILYPFELEAGDYEFYRWTTPEAGRYVEAVNDFSVKFHAVAGQVTYIGNLELQLRPGQRFVLIVSDMRDRDITELTNAYKNISRERVKIDLMQRESSIHF